MGGVQEVLEGLQSILEQGAGALRHLACPRAHWSEEVVVSRAVQAEGEARAGEEACRRQGGGLKQGLRRSENLIARPTAILSGIDDASFSHERLKCEARQLE